MSEITVRRGDKKDEITLARGGKVVTFKKIPNACTTDIRDSKS